MRVCSRYTTINVGLLSQFCSVRKPFLLLVQLAYKQKQVGVLESFKYQHVNLECFVNSRLTRET